MQDSRSFVALYEAQYPRVVAYARRRLGRAPDAEDCAAEVFRLAWEQDRTPSVGWLFVTARNTVYALGRARVRSTDLVSRIAAEEATDGDNAPDDDLLDALDQLPEADQELLKAFYWDDLSGGQCAALLGCSTGAVWVRLHRARQALKAVLQNDQVRAHQEPVPNPHWQGETP